MTFTNKYNKYKSFSRGEKKKSTTLTQIGEEEEEEDYEIHGFQSVLRFPRDPPRHRPPSSRRLLALRLLQRKNLPNFYLLWCFSYSLIHCICGVFLVIHAARVLHLFAAHHPWLCPWHHLCHLCSCSHRPPPRVL